MGHNKGKLAAKSVRAMLAIIRSNAMSLIDAFRVHSFAADH